MAWYTYNYSCGHEEQVQLYGKESDRQRRIDAASSRECKNCWIKTQKEEDAKADKVYTLDMSVTGDLPVVVMRLSGARDQNSRALAKLGFAWRDDITVGVMSALPFAIFGSGKKHFCAACEVLTPADGEQYCSAMGAQLAKLGYKLANIDETTGGFALAAEQFQRLEKKIEKLEEIRAGAKVPCPEFIQGKKWNGKYYGKGKNQVYLDGVEVNLTPEQLADLKKYQEAKSAKNQAIKNEGLEAIVDYKKPVVPEITDESLPEWFADMDGSDKWNGKIYRDAVYLSGDKVTLSPEQKMELQPFAIN